MVGKLFVKGDINSEASKELVIFIIGVVAGYLGNNLKKKMETDTIQQVAEQGLNWNMIGLYVSIAVVVIGIVWVLIRYKRKK